MCGSNGYIVKSSTVEHIANFETDSLKKEIMSVCFDPECEIVYFSSTYYPLVFEREIDIEIGFKESSSRKYICYCYKIERDDIVRGVLRNNIRTIKDVMSPYGDIVLERCEKEHPLGCDCIKDIRKLIDDTLKEYKIT